MNFYFGSDPEMMLVDRSGKHRSAIGIIKGSKEKRINLGNGHQAFYDNVLAECNVAAATGIDNVLASFRSCFGALANLVGPNYTLRPQASQMYPESELQHDDARVFGCDPEYDAYQLMANQPPDCTSNFRSGGGHIHLGREDWKQYSDEHSRSPKDGTGVLLIDVWSKVKAVKMMDVFCGVPSLYIDHDPTSVARRKIYGKAGAHRPKPYGVEYRSLSNFWIASPKLVEVMYELSGVVLSIMETSEEEAFLHKVDEDLIQKVINTGDKKAAQPLMDMVLETVPAALRDKLTELQKPTAYDFYVEWGIKQPKMAA